MKIICCVKPVPDAASRLVINESKTWIRDGDLNFVVNEADNYALEEALRIREKHGGEVVALALGGEAAARALRQALAMGADRAIHLSDATLSGGTEFVTAEALFRAIEKDGGAEIVLAGVQSDDRGAGVTGVMLAEFLGWPHATVAVRIEAQPENGVVVAERELEAGLHETVEMQLPALVTVQYGINQPRYASLKGIMAAKKKPFVVWSAADIGLDDGIASDALYDVKNVFVPERSAKVEILTGTPEEAAAKLVEKLRREAKVL